MKSNAMKTNDFSNDDDCTACNINRKDVSVPLFDVASGEMP